MMLTSTTWTLLSILITTVLALIAYMKWSLTYWERKGMPSLPTSFPFGNLKNSALQKTTLGVDFRDLYCKAKAAGYKHLGWYFFWAPHYMPIDPQVVKQIFTKDFNKFTDRPFYYNEEDDPISAHLFSIDGPKWRNLRVKLTPTFTSGKMKTMFPILIHCGDNMVQAIKDEKGPVDIRDIIGKYTLDVIGSCAFGLECNAFKGSGGDFQKYLHKVIHASPYEQFKLFFGVAFPNFSAKIGLVGTPQDAANFYMNIIKETVDYREKNNVQRNDFLQLLINLKNSGENGGLKIEEIAAQSFLFFIAGFETSSSALTFALYELTRYPDIQNKLREEIDSVLVKYDNELTYEGMMEMKYLGQVVDETLRKYPSLPFINRRAVVDYKIPNSDFVLKKGCTVQVPLLGYHYDPQYFKDPEKFDPERFSDENRGKIVPYTYLPFGEGPRNCIGLRFGLMQTKIGMVKLLRNFSFSLNKKTLTPITFDPKSVILTALGKVWLDVKNL